MMERIKNSLKSERGSLQLLFVLPFVSYALFQVVRQIRSMNSENRNEVKSDLIDQAKSKVIDGEIVEGGKDVTI